MPLTGTRAWLIVWGVAVAQLVSWGTQFYAFALYVVPMEKSLGWSRTELNAALSIGLLVAGLVAVPVGSWIDRVGGRALMTAGSLLGALLLALWPLVGSLWLFYALWAVLGLSMAATLYDSAFAVMTRTFPRDYRRAITAVTLVGGLASTAFIPLTQFLIERLGWQQSLHVLAAFNLLCAAIHFWLIPRATPPAQGAAIADDGEGLRAALRRPSFWTLTLSFTLNALTFTAMIFHLVPLLSDRGMGMELIVAGFTLIGPMQVAGRILLVTFGRRLSMGAVGSMVILAYPVVIVILMLPPSALTLFSFATIYGLANGTLTIIRGVIVADYYGQRAYGAINGAITMPTSIARAAAPFLAALIWQAAGGYAPVLWALFVVALVSALCFWLAVVLERRRLRPPGAGS